MGIFDDLLEPKEQPKVQPVVQPKVQPAVQPKEHPVVQPMSESRAIHRAPTVTFDNVQFRGTFRDYQQLVIDKAPQHLKDGRIHIVAAPGSGKTILGLELVRKLGKPALVLSPSVTIRQQWGERFCQNFMPEGGAEEDFLSYDLRTPKLITSVTYQALHAAYNRLLLKKEGNEEDDTDDSGLLTEETSAKQPTDYKDFDLLETIQKQGIGTICLDEAHHLRSEWQKALEGVLEALGSKVKVIALTATPPYDSTPAEWNRYTALCGPIDEEIFVPQLVAQKTLCPHQDYIYFSYPTDEETAVLRGYKSCAYETTKQIMASGLLAEAIENLEKTVDYNSRIDWLLENADALEAVFITAEQAGTPIRQDRKRLVRPSGKLRAFSIKYAQEAFQFILDHPEEFTQETAKKLQAELSQNGLIEKKKVGLISNEKINKMLVSSIGKLRSINEIVRNEYASLGVKLRMLILTDYIKKELLKLVGTEEVMTSLGTVPVFETLRRQYGEEISLCILSGTLVVIPDRIEGEILKLAEEREVHVTFRSLPGTGYSEAVFAGSNKNKVGIMTEAFALGLVQIMIGTKSLLGEGWDAPCVNSLILASFVGSFMLSNQMRGRAIRMDRNNPDKASNIWHLITLEPPLLFDNTLIQRAFEEELPENELMTSDDFVTLSRRFACFLGPWYHLDRVESGMDRLDILRPPYNKEGVENINRQMLDLSTERDVMVKHWTGSVKLNARTEVVETNEVPITCRPRGIFVRNLWLGIMELAVSVGLIAAGSILGEILNKYLGGGVIVTALIGVCSLVFGVKALLKFLCATRFVSPEKSIKTLGNCLLDTLKQLGEIESRKSHIEVRSNPSDTYVSCELVGAEARENEVFSKALKEMLSAIDNPRYVIIKKGHFLGKEYPRFSESYACPSCIGSKKENAELFSAELKKAAGGFLPVFTRNENGRKVLLTCRQKSYINQNEAAVKSKKSVHK